MASQQKGIILRQHKEPAFSAPIEVLGEIERITLPEGMYTGKNPEDLTAEEILNISNVAEIVDERDGEFLYKKLLRFKNKKAIIIVDAVDDEPYVSSQIIPALRFSEELCAAIKLAELVTLNDRAYIATYKNISDLQTHIPRRIGEYRVLKLHGGYPAENNIKNAAFGEPDVPKMIVGSGALVHLYRAVYEHRKQTSTFITVAGDCIKKSVNLEVPIGSSVSAVLDYCRVKSTPERVISGGSMTGISLEDTDITVVTATTRAILAFGRDEKNSQYNCIGCGRCINVCPVGINPMRISNIVNNSRYSDLRFLDAHTCIACGTCSYVCPSKLDLSDTIAKARRYSADHFAGITYEEFSEGEE